MKKKEITLLNAIIDDNIIVIDKLLKKGFLKRAANPNLLVINGKPVIFNLIEKNKIEILKILISSGLDPNNGYKTKCDFKYTEKDLLKNATISNDKGEIIIYPLAEAISQEKKEIIELLISSGANISSNLRDIEGRSIIYSAIKCGNINIINRLIDSGVNINIEHSKFIGTFKHNYWGDNHLEYYTTSEWDDSTPLSDAIQLKNNEVIKLLISKGSQINRLELEKSIQNSDLKTVKLLIN